MSNENQLTTLDQNQQSSQNLPAQVAIESSRVVAEALAALKVAKAFPRDENSAFNRIMTSCKRLSLANQAIYNLPISGKNQSGPSIRLAEVLAQAWGNLKFGVNEVSRMDGKSSCVAYCHDLETNTNSEIAFEVDHFIEVGTRGNKQQKWITDPAELDRLIANRGSKKLRQCILKVIPPDIVEEAMNQCKTTISKGDGSPLSDRVRKLVVWFGGFQVTQEMIEERLGHGIETVDSEEYLDLTAIATAMKDGQGKRATYFKVADEAPKSSSLNDLLKTDVKAPEAKAEPTQAEREKAELAAASKKTPPRQKSMSDADAEPPPREKVS